MKRLCKKLAPAVAVLFFAAQTQAATQYWDATGATPGLGGAPTSGTSWAAGAGYTHWTTDPTGSSATTTWSSGNDAVFDGTAALLRLNGAAAGVSIRSITALTSGYSIDGQLYGGKITFVSGTTGFVDVATSATLFITNANSTLKGLAGSASFEKKGAGTLFIRGSTGGLSSTTNSYTGHTILTDGILQFNTTVCSLGDGAGTLIFNGGSLQCDLAHTFPNPVAMGGNGTIRGSVSSGTRAITFTTGSISGSSGTLTINNTGTGGALQARFSGGGFDFSRPVTFANNISQLGLYSAEPTAAQTWSGFISGAGAIVRNVPSTVAGADSIISNGGNTYSGGTQIRAGFIGLGANNPLGTGNIIIGADPNPLGLFASGSARSLTNAIVFEATTATATNLQFRGSQPLTLSGPVTLNLHATPTHTLLTISNSADTTISGVISGSGKGLIKGGPGTLVISGANTYGGTTTNQNGILRLATGNDRLPTGTTLVLGSTGNSATFDLNGFNQTVAGLATAGTAASQTIGNTVAGESTLTINNSGTFTFGGLINDAVAIVKNGAGTLNLTGANGFTGDVDVNIGVLAVTVASALGDTTGTTTVASGAALQTSTTAAIAENITLNGTGVSGNGALRHTANNKTLSGAITLGSSDVRINCDANTLTLSGGVSGSGSPNLTIGGAGSVTISTLALNIGSGTLSKEGAATLTLSTANTVGAVAFDGGRLLLNNSGAAGSGMMTVGSGALAISASANLGLITVNNDITLSSGATPILSPAGAGGTTTLELSGIISGDGSLVRGRHSGSGAGTAVLSGANTFAGGLRIDSDPLVLGNKQALGTGTFTIGDPAGMVADIDLSGNTDLTGANAVTNAITVNTNFILSGSSGLEFSGDVSLAASPIITVSSSAPSDLSGDIGGTAFGLTKAGNGTLTLSGGNTYDGPTTVSAGTLLVNGSIGNGAVTVASAGTLGGSGTVGGAVTVNGTVAPGASIGTLTNGSVTLAGGGSLLCEIAATNNPGTGYDQLWVNTGVDVTATSGTPFTNKLVAVGLTQFDYDLTNEWLLITSADPVTNFAANAFVVDDSGFTNDLAGGTFAVEEGSIKVKFIPNRAPTASAANFTRSQGVPIKILIADLLAASSGDPDGDNRLLVNVGVDTAPGSGTASINGDYIEYLPSDLNSTAADSFSFRVRDDRNYRAGDTKREAVANITISVVTTPGGIAQEITTDGSSILVTFSGIPGYPYVVERGTNIYFTNYADILVTTNAPANGQFGITDPSPPTPSAYYRLKYNP